MNRLSRGFTLIEMAIVLVVVGLAASMAVRVVSTIGSSSKDAATTRRMDVIEKALEVYVIKNGCLPCPADGSKNTATDTTTISSVVYSTAGLADGGGTYVTGCAGAACRTTNLTVPWITLGLTEADITDGWGNRMRYVIADGTPCSGAARLAATNGMVRCGTSSFPTGGLTINNNDGGTASAQVAYVLISSGPDQSLALKATTGLLTSNVYSQSGSNGQYLNATATGASGSVTFAYGSYAPANGSTHFDDIVRFKSAALMITMCGSNACGNPAL